MTSKRISDITSKQPETLSISDGENPGGATYDGVDSAHSAVSAEGASYAEEYRAAMLNPTLKTSDKGKVFNCDIASGANIDEED